MGMLYGSQRTGSSCNCESSTKEPRETIGFASKSKREEPGEDACATQLKTQHTEMMKIRANVDSVLLGCTSVHGVMDY